MANFVQITGFNAYPARKYSTRTVTQIDPFLYLGHYVKFSYDFNYFQELIRILEQGGSFEQLEKHNEQPTIFTFDKETLQLTVNSPVNRRLSLTYKLNQPVVDEIIYLIKEDVKNTMADDAFREALKAANAKERLMKFRNKLESVPESPKEEKVEEIKQEEKTVTTPQINENNNSIIGQSIPEVKQEEVKAKTIWDVKEVKDIVFKAEKIDESKLSEVPLSKKMDIVGYFWPSQSGLIGRLYGINVPSREGYEEIRKYFGKIFNVAV